MSLDRSLKLKDALSRHRNVLTRAERVAVLEDEDRWSGEEKSVYGLPKVKHIKLAAGKKSKKAKADEAAAKTEATAK